MDRLKLATVIATVTLSLSLAATAKAASIVIDNFSDPTSSELHLIENPFVVGGEDPLHEEYSGAGIINGERELYIDVGGAGTTPPSAVDGSYNGNIGGGVFKFGSAGTPGSLAILTYEGADISGPETTNSQLLTDGSGGYDLTGGGLNNAFRLDFNYSDAGVGIKIEAFGDSGADLAVFTGSFGPSTTSSGPPFSYFVPFAAFIGDLVFADVSSIVFTFNESQAENVDFELSAITAVPLPLAAWAGMIGLGLVGIGRRKLLPSVQA